MVYTIQCSFVKFKRIPRTWVWGVFQKYNFNLPFGDDDLSFGSVRVCLHDTGTSFIVNVLQYLISYRVYMRVIVPNWHNVSCEPSFLQAILERCCLSTHMGYPSQSTRPLISHQDKTSYLLYMIPVQNVVRFHTGTNIFHRYKNWSELVPVWLVQY